MMPDKLKNLLNIMEKLRDPEEGCPWDVEQNFDSIAPFTIEEAYEVAEAITDKDFNGLKDELGDLLFQVIFLAQLAKEKKLFKFEDVVEAISDKMIRRHPHVFGNETIESAEVQTLAWEVQKEQERTIKAKSLKTPKSILDDVPIGLPALLRALKLQKRAARVGFDWPDTSHVIDKIKEEVVELSEALAQKDANGNVNEAHIREEFGDLLFVCANLARHLNIDPEESLRLANKKFIKRFYYIEEKAGVNITEKSLEELEVLWQQAKGSEKKIQE